MQLFVWMEHIVQVLSGWKGTRGNKHNIEQKKAFCISNRAKTMWSGSWLQTVTLQRDNTHSICLQYNQLNLIAHLTHHLTSLLLMFNLHFPFRPRRQRLRRDMKEYNWIWIVALIFSGLFNLSQFRGVDPNTSKTQLSICSARLHSLKWAITRWHLCGRPRATLRYLRPWKQSLRHIQLYKPPYSLHCQSKVRSRIALPLSFVVRHITGCWLDLW